MKNIRKLRVSVLAAVMAAAMMLCATGCFTGMMGVESVVPDNTVGSTEFDEDDKAAAETLKAYFDTFGAKDVEKLADMLCSECRLSYLNSANGTTRDDFVEMMQTNIDTTAAELGPDFKVNYDPDSFRSEDAGDYINILNDGLELNAEDGPVIDCAKIITATVWMTSSEGEDMPTETGSMLVYRYDGQWYIYGYVS